MYHKCSADILGLARTLMSVNVGIVQSSIGRQEMNRVSLEGFHQRAGLNEK